MSISKGIMAVMAVFFVLGAADRLLGNRFGLGEEFRRAFGLMGNITLSVVGLVVMAPWLAGGLEKAVRPVFALLGADPAMFPGALLGPDIAYPLAAAMADSPETAKFSALIVGSVMGNTIAFAIPVACGLIRREDYRALAVGALSGYLVDPLACLLGGLLCGLPFRAVLVNLIPVLIIAALLMAGLFLAPEAVIRGFRIFAKFLMALITLGLCAGALESLLGLTILPGQRPVIEGFRVVGSVVLTLGGSFPLLLVLRKLLRRPLETVAVRLRIPQITVLSMIMALNSVVPGYSDYPEMNVRGRVLFAAFTASISCMMGVCLGFSSSVDPGFVLPMLAAKISAMLLALPTSLFFARRFFTAEELDSVT